jgi:copper chaperone
MQTSLKVTGMTCGNCVRHVKEAIESVPGVTHVQVDLASGTATLNPGEASVEAIIDAIQEEGYEAEEV